MGNLCYPWRQFGTLGLILRSLIWELEYIFEFILKACTIHEMWISNRFVINCRSTNSSSNWPIINTKSHFYLIANYLKCTPCFLTCFLNLRYFCGNFGLVISCSLEDVSSALASCCIAVLD